MNDLRYELAPPRPNRFPPWRCLAILAIAVAGRLCPAQPAPSRIGSTHASGKYHFTSRDYLNEGAIELANGGMRVIKVWFGNPGPYYMWNSDWPRHFDDYVAVARHPYFQELFNRPFETYVLTILDDMGFQDGFSDPRPARLEKQFHDLARHLLETYRGTGKVFVLSHHEGDWHLRGNTDRSPKADPGPTSIQGMIRFYNARQAGVKSARAAVKDTDVKVYHAPEVNLVRIAMEGRPSVTNDVLPHTKCDLVSYSAWDTTNANPDDEQRTRRNVREALEYIASKMPDSRTLAPDGKPFGGKNVFIGEFGLPEEQFKEKGSTRLANVCRAVLREGLDFGCRYIIYWELYCNECCAPGDDPCLPKGGANPGAEPASVNAHCRGFWLRRVDGTYSPAWDILTGAIGSVVRPPADFSASLTSGGVELVWTDVADAAGYHIERSEGTGEFRPLGRVEKNVDSYTDASVATGKQYRYRLRSEAGDELRSPWFYSNHINPKP